MATIKKKNYEKEKLQNSTTENISFEKCGSRRLEAMTQKKKIETEKVY